MVNQRLQVLVSGNHPYSRWAQTLKIELGSLFPSIPREPGQYSTGAITKAVEDRNALIIPAIESLHKLKRAR